MPGQFDQSLQAPIHVLGVEAVAQSNDLVHFLRSSVGAMISLLTFIALYLVDYCQGCMCANGSIPGASGLRWRMGLVALSGWDSTIVWEGGKKMLLKKIMLTGKNKANSELREERDTEFRVKRYYFGERDLETKWFVCLVVFLFVWFFCKTMHVWEMLDLIRWV